MIAIFDLDGTLLNTITDLGYACNYALQQAGLPVHPVEAYPAMVGNGINNLIRRALPTDLQTEETVQRVRAFFVPYYNDHNCVYTHPYHGIHGLLQTLRAEGYLLAVASNKYQEATRHIVTHFFPGMFDVILGERPGVNRKPDPQIVYDILARLNAAQPDATPVHALRCDEPQVMPTAPSASPVHYIGDSLVDYQTACNASVPFIACSWGFVPREQLVAAGIQRIADTPDALLSFLRA